MESLNHKLAVLRAVCHGEPTSQGWGRLCQIIGRAQEEGQRQVLLDYAAPLLEAWPEALRHISAGHWRRIQSRGASPYWPLVREVEIKKADLHAVGLLVRLAQRGTPRSLKLSLKKQDAVAVCAALASSPLRLGLRRLLLRQGRLPDEALEVLLAQAWPSLEELDLRGNHLRLEGAPLLTGEALPALRALDLSQNHVHYNTICGLAEHGPPRLRSLNLYGAHQASPDAGPHTQGLLRVLDASPRLRELEEVAFSHYDVNASRDMALWARFHPAAPRVFTPGDRVLRPDVLQIFAQGGKLRHVQRLALDMCSQPLEAVHQILEALRAPAALPSLVDLSLRAQLDAQGLELLLQMPWLGQLRGLKLLSLQSWSMEGHSLGDEGVRRLVAQPALAGLEVLTLLSQGLGEAGVQALVGSPHLKGLRMLDLWGNALSAASMERLLDSALVRGQLELLSLEVFGQGAALARRWAACPAARQRQTPAALVASLQSTSIRQLLQLDRGDWAYLHTTGRWSWEGLLAWAEALGGPSLSLPRGVPAPEPEQCARFLLPAVRHLACWLPLEPGQWQAFTQVPWVAGLERLTVNNHEWGGQALEVLLAWEPPPGLGELCLCHRDNMRARDRERVEAWAQERGVRLV